MYNWLKKSVTKKAASFKYLLSYCLSCNYVKRFESTVRLGSLNTLSHVQKDRQYTSFTTEIVFLCSLLYLYNCGFSPNKSCCFLQAGLGNSTTTCCRMLHALLWNPPFCWSSSSFCFGSRFPATFPIMLHFFFSVLIMRTPDRRGGVDVSVRCFLPNYRPIVEQQSACLSLQLCSGSGRSNHILVFLGQQVAECPPVDGFNILR